MKKYPSDLTDAQWQVIKKLLNEKMLGHKRRWNLRYAQRTNFKYALSVVVTLVRAEVNSMILWFKNYN